MRKFSRIKLQKKQLTTIINPEITIKLTQHYLLFYI